MAGRGAEGEAVCDGRKGSEGGQAEEVQRVKIYEERRGFAPLLPPPPSPLLTSQKHWQSC